MKKLKDILSEVFDETPKVDKHKVIEGVRNFGIVGKSLYNNNNIMEIAKQLAEVAESAHSYILGEQDDWFDKVSVNRNMKSLKGGVMEFQKTAKEAHALNQRLTRGDASRANPYETEFLRSVLEKDKIIDRFRKYFGGKKGKRRN